MLTKDRLQTFLTLPDTIIHEDGTKYHRVHLNVFEDEEGNRIELELGYNSLKDSNRFTT